MGYFLVWFIGLLDCGIIKVISSRVFRCFMVRMVVSGLF